MEDKKRNHSWDEEEIKKYLEQSAEVEEIPPELETENMRKYIKTQTTGEQQKKHKNITGNIKHWYPAVTAACLCIILLAGVSGITRKAGIDQQTYGTKSQTKDTAAHTTYHNIYQRFPNFGRENMYRERYRNMPSERWYSRYGKNDSGIRRKIQMLFGVRQKKKAVIRQSMELLIHRKKMWMKEML